MKKKLCCAVALFLLPSISVLSATANRPNVLFIGVDDLNDWVGCFGGNSQVKTPHLDKFNEDGALVMMKAHAPSTLCGPSRTAILSGLYPHTSGIYLHEVNMHDAPNMQGVLTIPQYFSKYGYHSISRGKIFHRYDYKGKESDHGQWAFDEWYPPFPDTLPIGGSERPLNGLPQLEGDRQYYQQTAFDWAPTVGNDEKVMKDYRNAQWAVEQLSTRTFDKPFFMAVGFGKPHLPWYVPQKYFDMYPLDEIELPKTIARDRDDIPSTNPPPETEEQWLNWILQSTWRRVEKAGRHKEAVQAYLATVTFVDDCIGVLLDGLAKSPYADNTIVVLWADHGWHLGEKQRYGKTMLWQEACRVPLMVKVPGVTKGSMKCNGLVNLIDLYPTLLDLCGLPKNPKNEGRSFAKLLANPDMKWDKPLLSDYRYQGHRVFDGRYSYIVFREFGTEELYDHEKDPMEWHNLAHDPEYADIMKRLKALLPKKVAKKPMVKK